MKAWLSLYCNMPWRDIYQDIQWWEWKISWKNWWTQRKHKNSHVFQHSVNSNHDLVTLDDFTSLHLGYKHNKFKRKISEASFIKSNRPNHNKQDTSVPSKLFNWDFNHFLSWLFFVFTFESTFPNPIILAFEFYSAVNTIEFG